MVFFLYTTTINTLTILTFRGMRIGSSIFKQLGSFEEGGLLLVKTEQTASIHKRVSTFRRGAGRQDLFLEGRLNLRKGTTLVLPLEVG